MKISINGRNYTVTEKLQNIIEKKITRMDKYFGDDATCQIVCRKDGKTEKMEVSIVSRGQTYRGEVQTSNMYANIDIVLPKIEKQLIKHKDKLKTVLKKEAYEDKKLAYHVFVPKIEQSAIVKYKHFDVESCSHPEAAVNLDLSGHDFYIYSNAANGKICVMYKRKDGDNGVIEVGNSKMENQKVKEKEKTPAQGKTKTQRKNA